MHDLIIEAGRAERHYWKDLWRYRELFYFLAWRDLLVRYKQTVVGVGWSLFRPLMTMIVLTVVFGRFAKMPSGGVPYPVLVLCGVLPWQSFAAVLGESGNSLVNNSNLISKVYFPRMVIPATSIIINLVDFTISLVFLACLVVWYRLPLGLSILLLPVFTVLAFAAAAGFGLWIAALMVKNRDFRFIIPFALQLGLYISPVGFASTVIPSQYRLLYSLNPMVGVIDGFRWAILGHEHLIYWPGLALSCGIIALLLVTGIWYFRKTERTFADVI
jgi:lipopolysaccharide transport system permease protein